MKKLTYIAAALMALTLGACRDTDEVKQVRDGMLPSCADRSVEQMLKGLMASPTWKSGAGGDGASYVNVEGDMTFQNKPVRALLQFAVRGGHFALQALEVDGVPAGAGVTSGLLKQMCQHASGTYTQAEPDAAEPAPAMAAAPAPAPVPARPASKRKVAAPPAAPVPAHAAAAGQGGLCQGLESRAEQLECLGKQFNDSNRKLNLVYRQLMDVLDQPGKTKLRAEQLEWIESKGSQCAAAQALAAQDCEVRMTEQRLAYLQRY